MNDFDSRHSSLLETADEELEPHPVTAELLHDILKYIADLWHEHAEALKIRAEDRLEKVSDDLHSAYAELEALKDFIKTEAASIKPEVLDEAEYELWFACSALGKVLK